MKIKGLQKLTLLDYPEKMACTVFLAGCNFRCPFCHNASLVTNIDDDYISEEEFFSFLNKRKGILNGVCITGGEPTLQPDLIDFIGRVRELGLKVKLDSNGYRPDVLAEIVNNKLVDYIAMDIKNSPAKYPLTVGIPDFSIDNIEKSVSILRNCAIPYEFRTTIVKELHTHEDMHEIGKWLLGSPVLFLQSFVDSGEILQEGLSAHSKETLLEFQAILKTYIEKVELRGIS